MWVQVLVEAVAGSGLAVGMAYGLARHTGPADLPDPGEVDTRAARLLAQTYTPAAPAQGPVTGLAWGRVWEQAEQVGWARLLAAGVLRPVGSPAVDPGNLLGSHLVLVEHVAGAFGDCRVLLAVNASADPGGAYELVAIPVCAHFVDPVAAAAWTYDDDHHPVSTTPGAYASMARRT